MNTVIKFYDKDALKNILAVITIRPEKVIFLYDEELNDINRFLSLEKCFKVNNPHIILEKVPVNILDLDDIHKKILKLTYENENCIIELTGGSELMLISGYKAGSEINIKMVYTDIIKQEIFDITTGKKLYKTAKLTLDDFVNAKGARYIGNSHIEPPKEMYENILDMCNILFQNLRQWKSSCSYFQTALADTPSSNLEFKSKFSLSKKDGKKVQPDKNILVYFKKLGFIKNLTMSKDSIKFSFASKYARQYIINYGIWLELFVFINAKKMNVFDDVKLGTMIDWNAYDGMVIAGNEIDVILSINSMPVFISCKLREADTADLNELLIEKRRLGGWFSKAVLVSFSPNKKSHTGIYKRSLEMGIELMDKHDIMSKSFGEKLLKAVVEHDLVKLKWKKL